MPAPFERVRCPSASGEVAGQRRLDAVMLSGGVFRNRVQLDPTTARLDAERPVGDGGLAWGAGHAVTLLALGVPFVLWGDALPDRVQQAAEVTIGLLIVGLAVRLLIRWRRGSFHLHPHRHGEVVHAHPHMHEGGHRHEHRHAHPDALGRTPLAAFGIGLVHGVGGSAGAGILLVSSIGDRTMAALALVLFAVATALAMGLATLAFTHILAHRRVAVRLESAMPVIGGLGIAFGTWYALGSLEAVPYVF